MRFCYAFRRFSDYPYLGNAFDMDPSKLTDKFLYRVNEMGFDGESFGNILQNYRDYEIQNEMDELDKM